MKKNVEYKQDEVYSCTKEDYMKYPKLRGGASSPKFFIMEHKKVKNILTIIRSLAIFSEHHAHNKCPLQIKDTKSSLCKLCLMRSLTIRGNSLKGREKINPVEVFYEDLDYLQSIDEKNGIQFVLENIFNPLNQGTVFLLMDFDAKEHQGRNFTDLIKSTEMKGNKDATILIVACEHGTSVDLNSSLVFDSSPWKIKSVISKTKSLFYCNNNYYTVGKDENTLIHEFVIEEAVLIALESVEESVELDMSLSYTGNDLQKLKSTFDKRKGSYLIQLIPQQI